MNSNRRWSKRWAILVLMVGLGAFVRAGEVPPNLDALVERVRKEFEVPGIALAIVKDGEVMVKGYGERQAGEPENVDGETLFNIASNSKAFTAAALGLLMDEGKVRWDDPVTRHLPGFQMYDAWVTREMTVRDLLTHRSGLGLGAGDLLFWPPTSFTREEIVQRQRFIKPATSFRSRYAYDNCLYIVAGEVVRAAAGMSWDDFVRERFFSPLGMNQTSINREALAGVENKAAAHVLSEGRMVTVDYVNVENVAAAGGINSCAADMARWVAALLEAGRGRDFTVGGKRVLSTARVQEMWSAQTLIAIGEPAAALAGTKPNFAAYGLGFGLRDYRGQKIAWHGGGLPGQISRVALAPDLNLGIVLLSNKEPNDGLMALTFHILDHYLKAPPTDWVTAYRQVAEAERGKAAATVAGLSDKRAKGTKPSLALEQYAGRYVDGWYGDVILELEAGKLAIRFSRTEALVGDLEHWQHDTFVARWRDRTLNADAFVYFALNPDGTIDGMKMKAVSPLTDFSFDFHDLDFKPAPKTEK